MESNTIVDTNKEASNGEEEVISTRQTSNDQSQDPPTSGKTIRRENDSLDDFEHLEHEPSPHEETRGDMNNLIDVTSGQLIGASRVNRSKASNDSRVTELMNVASKLERDILDTGVPVDEKFLQPVPATPPPSANFDKYEQLQGPLDVTTTTSAHVQQQQQQQQQLDSAQTSPEFVAQNYELDLGEKHRLLSEIRPDDYQQTHNQMDSKAATMAFMETERTLGGDDFNRANVNIEKRNEEQDKRVDEFFADEKILNPNIDDRAVSGGKDNAGSLNARLAPDKNDEKASVDILKDTKSEENIKERSISPIKTNSLMDDEDVNEEKKHDDFVSDITSSVLPGPEKSPEFDFLAGETSPNLETRNVPVAEAKNLMDDDTWNLVEKPENKSATNFTNKEIIEESHNAGKNYHDEAPTKPLPPLPKNEIEEEHESFARRTDFERERLQHDETFEMSNDFMSSAGSKVTRGQQQQQSGAETGDSEFESAPEQSPAKSTTGRSTNETSAYYSGRKVHADDIAPKEIFTDMGLDAWFNPERLNPKVAALIYWRQPEKTGVVFGAILGVLLSLAYFSLISVFAYLSLLILTGTVGFRVYKTFMQAVQKTSDGHPFKDILEIDLTLPAEKVHEVADVAVAHANAAVAELRRRFLVEDFIDSLKFGVVLWCFTYVGSWFNGMTLIIIGVVALFTLPKVYETNKAQIDQNVALVQGKINELTAKVRAAIPLGKKAEPTKEE